MLLMGIFFYWDLLLDHDNFFIKKNYASNKKRHAFIIIIIKKS